MNRFLLALMLAVFMVGCASTGGGQLPEIAPYDEPYYEPLWEPLPEVAPHDEPSYKPLPKMVPAS